MSPKHILQKWGELDVCLFIFVILTAMMLAIGALEQILVHKRRRWKGC
jgi:hypothetical protein